MQDEYHIYFRVVFHMDFNQSSKKSNLWSHFIVQGQIMSSIANGLTATFQTCAKVDPGQRIGPCRVLSYA